MTILTFAFNEDTLNTEIEILDEALDIKNAILKIAYLKSFVYSILFLLLILLLFFLLPLQRNY